MKACAHTSAPRHRLVGDPSTLLMTLCCALALSIHMAPARAVEACRGEAPIVTQGRVERAALNRTPRGLARRRVAVKQHKPLQY